MLRRGGRRIGAANDMDTSSSVLGKRARNTGEPLVIEPPETGKNGKRPRRDALAIALAIDMSVVLERDRGLNPALKPQVEALQSSVVKVSTVRFQHELRMSAIVSRGRNYRRKKRKCVQTWFMGASYVILQLGKSLMFTRNATREMFRRKLRKRDGFKLGRGSMQRNGSKRAL